MPASLLQLSPEVVQWNEKIFSCSIGSSGFIEERLKREGDKKTPIGRFYFMYGFYRPDKGQKPESSLPFFEITESLCWCDDLLSSCYNKSFNLMDLDPLKIKSYENLWRDDDKYDLIVVVDYNLNPVILGHGSAIFIHCTDGEVPPYKPSLGCIKLAKKDLLEILRTANSDSVWDLTKVLMPGILMYSWGFII